MTTKTTPMKKATKKKTKLPAVPESTALRQLEHRVRTTSPERQPELRVAVRRVLALPHPEAHDHPPTLGFAISQLQTAEKALTGPDPEACLVYLSFGMESLAHLVGHTLAELGAGKASGRSA